MTASTAPPPRIATLDIVRGVAVMGILAMNIVGFAMPFAAYSNPLAFGSDGAADFASWTLSFVLVDGKMRGLFTFLFGASLLLVIQRAESSGQTAASVTFRRLLWLLLFGMLHYYLIWFGDILIGYAVVGMIAWVFRRRSTTSMTGLGLALILFQFLLVSGLAASVQMLSGAAALPGADPAIVQQWAALSGKFGGSPEALQQDLALHLGPWSDQFAHRAGDKATQPFMFILMFGWETLGYMLLGMAALKGGFLTGAWEDRLYRKVALVGFAVAIPASAFIASMLFADGFTVPGQFTWSMAAAIPFRLMMTLAYAALIIIATRSGGWLVDRIAAAGRTAFTNYLGTSIVMTTVFYGWGLGLYGAVGRAELWLFVIVAWVLMLAWSKPWLDRFTYGPFEWLWRSLARWELQPMRKNSSLSRSDGQGDHAKHGGGVNGDEQNPSTTRLR